ncbi:hypothetical protein H4R19_001240 [Coemansia spiralis]|nr:hypothetical protein H4R19_001240 [Coemansia spiralis]
MSLSLVPEYDSATSSSDSEAEAAPSQTPPARKLGSVLSSILPPPKGAASAAAAARPAGAQKVRIVVDLPAPRGAPSTGTVRAPPASSSSSVRQSAGGSLSSELFAMLPAPKNSSNSRPEAAAATDSPQQAPTQPSRTLIPHSLSSKLRTKPKPLAQPNTAQPLVATSADYPAKAVEAGGESFFTIGAAAAPDVKLLDETTSVADAKEAGPVASSGTHVDMIYDPTSGYYYDTASGTYHYYDADRGEYADVRELHLGDVHDDDEPVPSAVGGADLEKLLRRGELGAAVGAGIATVSRSTQLAGGEYSDARAAADYSARRAAEQQQQTTRRRIDSGEVGKQKKHKHNIMYLAHQAQEHAASLNEAHANQKAAKKAARARYGM